MKNNLFTALFFSFALSSSPAHAGPVIGVIGSISAALTAAATAIGTWAVTTFGVSAAAGAAFGTAAVQLAVGLGLYLISSLLTPRPRIPDPSDRMANFAQPLSYFETVYGRVRKGGPIGFTGFSGDRRHYTIILASHKIEGIYEHWLDEWVVEVDGSDLVTTEPIFNGGTSYGSIRFYDGDFSQAADATLVAAFPQWTSSHDMTGLAYSALWAQRPPSELFTEIFPESRQWAHTPVVDAKDDLYDPRDGLYKYSNNAALVIADWIVNVLLEEVDWTEVATEADVSDSLVDLKDGGTGPKWTLSGVINDQEEFESVRAQLGVACDCYFYERFDGKIGFKVGRFIEPDVTLTEDDFYALTVSEGNAGSGNSNEIVIRYVEPDNAYRETPSGVWVADPEGPRTRQEYAVFWCDRHNQAIRIAKRLSSVIFAQYRISGTLRSTAQSVIGKRFVTINNAELGVSGIFEITKVVKNEDLLTYEIEGHSVVQSDFDFDPLTEEPEQPKYDTVFDAEDDYTPLSLTATVDSASGVPIAVLEWTMPYGSSATEIRYRVSLPSVGEWNQVPIVGAGIYTYSVSPLQDGNTYEFQIRAVSSEGNAYSDWFPTTPVQLVAVAYSTPPAALSSFSIAGTAPYEVTVSLVSPNDPLYAATRIYRANYPTGYTGSFNIADAAVIQTEYGAPNSADSYVDDTIYPGVFAYWGVAINSSGIEATPVGPEDISVA